MSAPSCGPPSGGAAGPDRVAREGAAEIPDGAQRMGGAHHVLEAGLVQSRSASLTTSGGSSLITGMPWPGDLGQDAVAGEQRHQDQLAEQAGAGLLHERVGGAFSRRLCGGPNSIASIMPLPRTSLTSS